MEKKTHMPGTCSDTKKKQLFLYKIKPGSMFALIAMSYSMKKATFCSDFVKKYHFLSLYMLQIMDKKTHIPRTCSDNKQQYIII